MKRNLRTGEKVLIGVSFLAIFSLVIVGRQRAEHPRTVQQTCKSLVKAMLRQDDVSVKRLTTAKGYSSLQGVMKSSPFNSYPKLANRMVMEWGKSEVWEIEPLREQEGFGLSTEDRRQGKRYGLNFRQTPQGWKLDEYEPMTNKLLAPRRTFGKMWNLDE